MNTPGAPSPLLRLSVRGADARIELAADAVLRTCLTALNLDEVPLPIPIEAWIERPLGYRFGVTDADELGEGVLGLARPATGELLVSDQLLKHEARLRFTCAHELAHHVLHAGDADTHRDGDLPHESAAGAVEREADRFAAAFLMPVATLAGEFERIRLEACLRSEAMALLRGDDILSVWLWRRRFLPALAERYGVSRAAMAYRCRELRLPGQRRLVRPSLIPLLVAPGHAIGALELDRVELRDGLPVVI